MAVVSVGRRIRISQLCSEFEATVEYLTLPGRKKRRGSKPVVVSNAYILVIRRPKQGDCSKFGTA